MTPTALFVLILLILAGGIVTLIAGLITGSKNKAVADALWFVSLSAVMVAIAHAIAPLNFIIYLGY